MDKTGVLGVTNCGFAYGSVNDHPYLWRKTINEWKIVDISKIAHQCLIAVGEGTTITHIRDIFIGFETNKIKQILFQGKNIKGKRIYYKYKN